MKPGIYKDIPFDEYRKIDAVNSSSLKNMFVSPLNYRFKLDPSDSSTKSMDIGRAAHTAILEGHRFDGDYVVFDGTRRGKKWEEFKELNQQKEILTESEMSKVSQIKQAADNHERAAEIISECDNEVTVIFTEQSTGLLCKARIDSLDKAYRYFADMKTAREVEPYLFARQSATLLYHFQYAFYRIALHTITGVWLPVKCIAIQNTPPYDVVVYNVSQQAVDKGMGMVMDCMCKLKECLESDKWPGISDNEIDLELPAWAADAEEDELIIGDKKVMI